MSSFCLFIFAATLMASKVKRPRYFEFLNFQHVDLILLKTNVTNSKNTLTFKNALSASPKYCRALCVFYTVVAKLQQAYVHCTVSCPNREEMVQFSLLGSYLKNADRS